MPYIKIKRLSLPLKNEKLFLLLCCQDVTYFWQAHHPPAVSCIFCQKDQMLTVHLQLSDNLQKTVILLL